LEDISNNDYRKQNEEVEVDYYVAEGHTNSDDETVRAREIPPDADSSLKVLAQRGSCRKRRGVKIETFQDRVEKSYQMLRNVCENRDKDECALYAELLAKKLRALDENRREIVMYEIDNLMFRAKMQTQNFNLVPSSSYSIPPRGLHPVSHTAETANCRPCSFPQDHSRTPMFIPSSESSLEVKNLDFTADLP
jgi:hypothetical protein